MADTDVKECKICGHETDCIQGICLGCSLKEPKVFKTAIPYHPDECPGCVHIHHQKGQYNIIFKCNECGDQRKLCLDPDDGYAFPIGLTDPANDDEIKLQSINQQNKVATKSHRQLIQSGRLQHYGLEASR